MCLPATLLAQAEPVRLTTFYETWPGDNIAPPVQTAVTITYDAHALYVGIWAQDPDPRHVHAAYADRDNVGGTDDYVALVLDTRGDGRVGTIFRISPRGVQADGVFNEAQFALGNPDDLTPDFAWDARTAIGDSAWTAELRIPFTSLRYPSRRRQLWGVIVHRVYPRDFVHSIFSVRMPRGTTCFLCHAQRLELSDLPTGGGLLIAPYATAQGPADPRAGGGGDLKWTPGAGTALDVTLRPDFSQIESDVAQLGVNTPFALSYPEKRPFFLEGADLFQTPIQAVYTRSIAAPAWGGHLTGELGRTAYTLLVARDRAGGSAILPGAAQSSLVTRDYASTAGIARLRTAFSSGFVGLLATDREGGGHNRVLGPDLFWNVTGSDQVTGQLLASDFTSGALDLAWHHLERHAEWFAEYRDVGAGFRADNGFVPQVGVRVVNTWASPSFNPGGTITWVAPWVRWQRTSDRSTGDVVSEYRYAGIQFAGPRNLYFQLRYSDERLRAQDSLLRRRYAFLVLDVAPGRRLARVMVVARLGGDVDVANGRRGRGGEVWDSVALHAGDHLSLEGLSDLTWLDVPAGRLFTAAVERLRATYNVTPRLALRLVAQQVRIRRDPALYLAPTTAVEGGGVTLAALLSYRWNWASAAYVGLGQRHVFFKVQAARP